MTPWMRAYSSSVVVLGLARTSSLRNMFNDLPKQEAILSIFSNDRIRVILYR